jgi:glycosyltransferase involved in cell wall biosynthesis
MIHPRKLLHIITTIERGGAENQLLTLAKGQVDLGFDVNIIYLKGLPDLEEKFKDFGAKVHHIVANKTFLTQVLSIYKFLRNWDGIVHAHLPQSEIISRLSGVKNLVVTRHFGGAFYPRFPGAISKIISRLTISGNTKVIAISSAVRNYLLESGEVSSKKDIKVIHYGFDSLAFLRETNDYIVEEDVIQFLQGAFVVGIVARLSPEKDHETFLKAFKLLSDEVPFAKGLIIGSGPSMERLQELSKKLGLEEKVYWAGKKSNVGAYMKLMDVLVLTSRFEGFGMVLLEGMASKLPIIATDVSAIPEVIGNGGPGILFGPGNFMEVASQLIDLAKSIEMRDRIGILGINWVKHFSVNDMVDKVVSVYES